MRTIRLAQGDTIPPEKANDLLGTFLDSSHVKTVIDDEDTEVFKPDGTLLLRFLKGRLSTESCRQAYVALRDAAGSTNNRGIAGGTTAEGETRSVQSGIVGAFDRYPRIPYCRLTAFTLEHRDRFDAAMPFITQVDELFREHVPDRHATQRAMIRRTHPDWVIHGTAFTTVTVNRNYRTAVHRDAGDLRDGFGVIAALKAGNFTGGILVFPQYGVGVDISTKDVLFCDVHELHGNLPIIGTPGEYERISFVFYYRTKMIECGSAEEELERAKMRGAM